MKPKNLKEAYKHIRELMKRVESITKNYHEDWLIGDVESDIHVQFSPMIRCYYQDKSGEIHLTELGWDKRKLSCGKDGYDWRNLLLGKKGK